LKHLGIIGGTGPESTIDYYRSLVTLCRERAADGSYPRIFINSVDLKLIFDFVESGDLDGLRDYLFVEVERLASAGADFAVFSANLPHIVFDAVERLASIPLLSIVRATRDAASQRGFTRLAILGARATMQGHFYSDVFADAGITLIAPDGDDLPLVHDKYVNEMVKGVFRPETRDLMLDVIVRMKRDHAIEGAVLAGTSFRFFCAITTRAASSSSTRRGSTSALSLTRCSSEVTREKNARPPSVRSRRICAAPSGQHVLDRRARSADRRDRRRGAVALVRGRPDRAVGRGGRRRGGDAELCRSVVWPARPGAVAHRKGGARRVAGTARH
jgi:aspartate racemase